jgi:hypothetical protein
MILVGLIGLHLGMKRKDLERGWMENSVQETIMTRQNIRRSSTHSQSRGDPGKSQ